MNSYDSVIKSLKDFINDSQRLACATEMVKQLETLYNPLLDFAFKKSNTIFPINPYYSITWNTELNLKQKLAIIASANIDEVVLKKLKASFVYMDREGMSKLIHCQDFGSITVCPHDSMKDLFDSFGDGSYYLKLDVSSKQIGESIFKYLLDSNGKVSSETTSLSEEFHILGDGKSTTKPNILEKQKPSLLISVTELFRYITIFGSTLIFFGIYFTVRVSRGS